MNSIIKSLEINKTLNDAVPLLVQIFTDFYGEKYRKYITDKFNNMIFVGYYDDTTLERLISNLRDRLTIDCVKEIFDRFQIEYNQDNVRKYTGNYNFNDFKIFPIIDVCRYISMIKEGDNGINNERSRVIDKIREIYPTANINNVDKLILSGELDEIFEIGRAFLNAWQEYNEYCKQNIDKYISLNYKMKNLKEKIEYKYFIQYLLELRGYLNTDDQRSLDKLVKQDNFDISDLRSINIFRGNPNIYVIQYFDSKSEEDLKSQDVKAYKKEIIKKNRIWYFKYHGLDLGDRYEVYANNPKCIKMWPDKEMIDKIQERLDYYHNQVNIEYFTNFDIYKKTMERVHTEGLLDKESIFEPAMFLRKRNCVCTNLKKENGRYKLYPIVCIYAYNDEYDDKTLMHELNHLFELVLTGASEDEYEVVCGWDKLICHMNQKQEKFSDTTKLDKEVREYEIFNEVINELIARKMTEVMHNNGVFILNDKDNYKNKGGTIYDLSMFLANNFFNKYFDEIIASRLNNSIEIIWNKVGKDNFDELNQLFVEFNKIFTGEKYEVLREDKKNGRDSELVRKYDMLVRRRDIILANMDRYSKRNSSRL